MSRSHARHGLLLSALLLCLSPGLLATDPVKTKAGDGWELPFSVGIKARMLSDYVWRGFNLSDPPRSEKPEKPNYDLELALDTDLERWTGHKLGRVGGFIWWEWFAGQPLFAASGNKDRYLQEVDYDLHWEYDLKDLGPNLAFLGGTLSLGWINYTLPQVKGRGHETSEWYITMAFDDSAWWGLDRPILSPKVTFWHDYDDVDGSWLDISFSHEFSLGDCPVLAGMPLLGDLTFTPSFALGYDMHYSNTDTNRLATLVYGGEVAYPLTGVLGLPESCTVTLAGFAYYSDAQDSSTGTEDTLYGGLSLAFAF